jgi:hypothetical protein
MIRILRMTGRCANGNERDGGKQYHAVDQSGVSRELCGAEPGRLSSWSDDVGAAVTCPRCLARLQKQAQAAPAIVGELESLAGACWDASSGALLRPSLKAVQRAQALLAVLGRKS